MKYSKEVIYSVMTFMRALHRELGDTVDNKVEAMLDAFDPALRKQLLLAMIKGDVSGAISIRRVPGLQNYQKIHAIKEVRAISGLGLKEAKDIIDNADIGTISKIDGDFTLDQRNHFAAAIRNTGYEIA